MLSAKKLKLSKNYTTANTELKILNIRKYPIESGEPCRRHNCMKCCIKTEMLLTHSDVKRISSLGYEIEEFAVKVGKEWRLKNVSGKCYFLTENGCRIYNFRPEGCRLYPLVYHETRGKLVLDELCLYREEFKPKKSDFEMLLALLKELKAEVNR